MDIGGNYRRLTVVVVDGWFGRESQHAFSRVFHWVFEDEGSRFGFWILLGWIDSINSNTNDYLHLQFVRCLDHVLEAS